VKTKTEQFADILRYPDFGVVKTLISNGEEPEPVSVLKHPLKVIRVSDVLPKSALEREERQDEYYASFGKVREKKRVTDAQVQEEIDRHSQLARDVARNRGQIFENVKHMRWFKDALRNEMEDDRYFSKKRYMAGMRPDVELQGENLVVTPNPMFSNKVKTIKMSQEDIEGFKRWKDGELVQSAFPHWSPDKRELLLTGMDDVEFKKYVGG
jgi:hypothetical protein